MNFKSLLCGVACAVAALPALACYTVYDQNNRVVYNAQTPPVDMRYQIHETLPRVFPGGHLVFGDSQECPLTSAGWASRPDTLARLGAMPSANLLPGVTDASDLVITELRDPAVTLYGRMHDQAW